MKQFAGESLLVLYTVLASRQGWFMSHVAVLGASTDRAKFGNRALRAYRQSGHSVYPINPQEGEIESLRCYASVGDVPVALDVISVYVPPSVLLSLLPQIAEKGCAELWINPGAESVEALELARSLGLNVIQACSIVGLGLSPQSF